MAPSLEVAPCTSMVVIKRYKRSHPTGGISHYSIRHRFDRVYQIFHDDPYVGISQPYEFDYRVISGHFGDLVSAEAELRRMYPDIESDIQMSSKNIESSLFEGADKLVPFFPTWPCFHDAEIVELHLWRGHVYAGDWDDRNIFPILTIKVLVLEATQPGATGAGNDVLVTLRFHDVDQVELRDFNHNNSIVGLSVNKQSRGAAEDELAPYLAVVLEQGFGLSASFRCFRIEILSVERAPSGPIGKSEP